MSVLSDAPDWWERAHRGRQFCAPNAPWLMATEVGWPVRHANTLLRGDDDFLQGARECSAYLLTTGLAPDAVYGIGVTVGDRDVGHPEGKIVFSRGRFRITRH